MPVSHWQFAVWNSGYPIISIRSLLWTTSKTSSCWISCLSPLHTIIGTCCPHSTVSAPPLHSSCQPHSCTTIAEQSRRGGGGDVGCIRTTRTQWRGGPINVPTGKEREVRRPVHVSMNLPDKMFLMQRITGLRGDRLHPTFQRSSSISVPHDNPSRRCRSGITFNTWWV